MFEVNVRGMFSIVDLARKLPNLNSLFSVSTDKAANPVSYMGVSKRLMEMILFSSVPSLASSARFANVCFSTGSLLHSWINRISCGEPIAAPKDTLRYFITPEESGQLCLIASTVPEKGLISAPTLNPTTDLQNLDYVLFKILDYLKLEAVPFTSEQSALENSLKLAELGKQAVLITERDTSGEKSFEEFLGRGETVKNFMPSIDLISTPRILPGSLNDLREEFDAILNNSARSPSYQPILAAVKRFVPDFQHTDSNKSLDTRL
jgi:FlaA1/EpsC-like NDP-sugar epimerase